MNVTPGTALFLLPQQDNGDARHFAEVNLFFRCEKCFWNL